MEGLLGFLGFIIVSAVIAAASTGTQYLIVQHRAASQGHKQLPLLFGLMRYIVWEPNEAVVIMKKGKIKTIRKEGGGSTIVYPILGESVREWVDLSDHMVIWHDSEGVLTREGLKINVELALWWAIDDVEKYSFKIGEGIHRENEHQQKEQPETAEIWLMNMIENSLRPLISRVSVTQLVSAHPAEYFGDTASHVVPDHFDIEIDKNVTSAFERDLMAGIGEKVHSYGITVKRLEFQDVSLPAEIQKEVHEVWKTFMLPTKAEQEGNAEIIRIEKLKQSLGGDAVALERFLGKLQGTTLGYPLPFLTPLLEGLGEKTKAGMQAKKDNHAIDSGAERAALPNSKSSVAECSQCGVPTLPESRFCSGCGAKLSTISES